MAGPSLRPLPIRFAGAALLAGLALAVTLPSRAETIPITGTLTDGDERPLEGAEVALHPLTSQAGRGRLLASGKAYPDAVERDVTGDDGRFRLAAPEAGFWTVVARAEGRVPMEHPLWPILAPAELEPVPLLVDSGLRVQVVDEGEKPLSGVVVELSGSGPPADRFRRRPGDWRPVADRLAITGDAGRVRLPRFEDEEVALWAVAPGRTARQRVSDPPEDGALRLVLPRVASRRLRVVEPDGGAAVGAVVWFAAPIPAGVTDEEGMLDLPLPPAEPPDDSVDRIGVQVDSVDGLVAEAEVDTRREGDEKKPFRIRLGEPPVAFGRVVEAGSRIGGARVGLAGALVWPSRDPTAVVRADRTGSFRIAVRSTWERESLQAVAPGFVEGRSSLPDRGPGSGEEVLLVLEPAVDLPGSVVDAEGYAVADAAVRIVRRQGSGPAWDKPGVFVRTGSDGRFRATGLEAGTPHVVHVSREGYAPAVEDVPPVAAASGTDRTRSLPEMEIVLREDRVLRGRVIGETGEPVTDARARVVLESVGRLASAGRPGLEDTVTGPKGSFELVELPAGRGLLEISAPGYAPLWKDGFELPKGGGVTDLGDLVLEPAASLEGRVLDQDGEPLPEASVAALVAPGAVLERVTFSGPSSAMRTVETGADGGFRLEDLPREQGLLLKVRKEGYVDARFEGVRAPVNEPLEVILQRAATIRGAVVDDRGRAIPDAEVRPSWRARSPGTRSGFFGRVRTDDRGAFEISGLTPGTVAIEAEASGYRLSSPVTLELAPGELREGVEVVLREGISLTGRVVGPDGRPVAGARISANFDGRFWRAASGAHGRTKPDGRFELDTLAPGRVVVRARKEGLTEAFETVELGPGGASVELELGRGAEVGGRLLEPDGAPAAGRDLRLRRTRTDGGFSVETQREQTTAADGSFLFRGISDGEYRMLVTDGRFSGWTAPEPIVVEEGTPVTGLELRLPATATLRGRLLGLEPRELLGSTVRAWSGESGAAGPRTGVVEDDGSYRIAGLTPGSWQVTAVGGVDARRGQAEVEIEPGQKEATLDLEIREGYTVTGIVLSAGEPVAGAHVGVFGAGISGLDRVTTGAEGRFRIEGVLEGRRTLSVRDPASGAASYREIEVDGDRDVRVDLTSHRVRGVVYDAEGSVPIGDASVQLVMSPDTGDRRAFIPLSTMTGDDGSFLIPGVTEGRWSLVVEKPGYATHGSELEVVAGDVEAAPVFLEPVGDLEVRVRLADGRRPSTLMYSLMITGAQSPSPNAVRAVEPGRFVLDTVPPGSRELLFWSAEGAFTRAEVEAPGTVEVVLPEPCSLEVSVPALAADGSTGRLVLRDASGRAPVPQLDGRGIPLQAGGMEIPNLAPGAWTAIVTAEDGRAWSGTVKLTPEGPNRLVLESP